MSTPARWRRTAAIDCGTNSIRLLVADIDPEHGIARDVVREMVIVRLGEGGNPPEGHAAVIDAFLRKLALAVHPLGD